MTRLGRPLTVLVLASLWGCSPEPAAAPPPPQPAKEAAAPEGSVALEEPTIEEEGVGPAAPGTATRNGEQTRSILGEDNVGAPEAEPRLKSAPKRPRSQKPPPPPRGAAPIQAATSSGGSISPEAIRKVVRGGISEVRSCYERTLLKDPQLAGKVSASFTIDPTGRVSEVRAKGLRQDLESCLETAIRKWTFPAPSGGGVVRVTYPFVFQPSS